jgi:hypothetical protein
MTLKRLDNLLGSLGFLAVHGLLSKVYNCQAAARIEWEVVGDDTGREADLC